MLSGERFESERTESVQLSTLEMTRVTVSWRRAHHELTRLATMRAKLDVEEARWLVIAKRTRAHVELGFATFLEYVERTLGYQRRAAYERVRVAEALEDLPQTRELLEVGEISYSAVREITRVAQAHDEHEWLALIDGKSIGDVERLLRGRKPGDSPSEPPDPDREPRRWMLDLQPEVHAALKETRRRIEEEIGETLDDNAFMAALCERALGGAASDNARAKYQVAITVCEQCDRATQDGGGEIVDIDQHVVERARCDADIVRADEPSRVTSEIPLTIRRQVLARDHHRCTVPGCRSSKWLEIHHIVPRAAGGGHDPWNLTTLCGAHHGAHHEGRLMIRGEAPHLTFEHRDGVRYGDDFFGEVRSALRGLGFTAKIADDATRKISAQLGTDVALPDAIRAALAECPRPSYSSYSKA
jgi:hypothetical protein